MGEIMNRINLRSATESEMARQLFCAWSGLVILLSIVPFCFGQKDFGMDEKLKIEQYKRANPLYLAGQKDFKKEKFQKAREKVMKCIEFMPEHANAWLLLAQIESKENNLGQALEDVQKAKMNFVHIAQFQTLTQERLFAELREQKAGLQEQANALESALAQMGSSQSPDAAKLSAELGRIKGDIMNIDSQTQRPIGSTIDIPAEYFYVHGNIFFKMRRFDDARDQYLEVIKRDPAYGNAYNNLANLYFIAKDYQKALDYLTQAESNRATINPKLKEAVLKALGK
jgi:tetratricopeptide (TPR) repeat protein